MIALSPRGGLLVRLTPGRPLQIFSRHRAAGPLAIEADGVASVVAFDEEIWTFAPDDAGSTVARYSDRGHRFGASVSLPVGPHPTVRLAPLTDLTTVVRGVEQYSLVADCGELVAQRLAVPGLAVPLAARRWAAVVGQSIKVIDGGGERVLCAHPELAQLRVIDGFAFGTMPMLALVLGSASHQQIMVFDARNGARTTSMRLQDVGSFRISEQRGLAVFLVGQRTLVLVDLRSGRLIRKLDLEPVVDFALDGDGETLAIEWPDGSLAIATVDSFARGAPSFAPLHPDGHGRGLDAVSAEASPAEAVEAARADEPPRIGPAALGGATAVVPEGADPLGSIVDLTARRASALGQARPPLLALRPRDQQGSCPPEVSLRFLSRHLELVAARCRRAVAAAWNSGRLSLQEPGSFPFEREITGLLGGGTPLADRMLETSDAELTRIAQGHAYMVARAATSSNWDGALALGMVDLSGPSIAPMRELTAEFELSDLAAEILIVLAAPFLRGELARVYAVISNDPKRPLCDELLVCQILGPRASAEAIAAELHPTSPLVRHGLVHVAAGRRPFASIEIDPIVIGRLRADPLAMGSDDLVERRTADTSLEDFVTADHVIPQLLQALSHPASDRAVRLVVTGRAGSGRTTLMAALAGDARRQLGVIDMAKLLRRREGAGELFGIAVRRATLQGWIPTLSNLDFIPETETTIRQIVREVVRAHPGPIFVRNRTGSHPPIDGGFLAAELPPLTEGERLALCVRRLDEARLPAGAARDFVAKYRIGPAQLTRVIRRVAVVSREQPEIGIDVHLADTARQFQEGSMGSLATRMTRLASWANVVLPDETIDSVREFIARVRHRRRVFEEWGFDRIMTSSRGLTALFQGGPGTGKSMLAGVIARELGYHLYRIDLGQIVSKWIGETEKNLGGLFDAAEEGDALLLFDEADSLFAKRTEVKSSVDRYANLEVNYLLQRLDTFEGVAILTSNLGRSIDPAFLRRLSFRLTFPFPDAEMRERLWRVHLPPELPIEGPLDFSKLAQRHPISGGYIRNAALRAAFLAAQADEPVNQRTLERAIELEYRELGKLSDSGTLE